jgi:hypothetical protein
MQIVIDTHGDVRAVDSPLVAALDLGTAVKRRASNVVPKNRLLRALFRHLRDCYGETGVVAAFTRRWPCLWIADLTPSGGGVYGPFRRRAAAIAFEIAYLETHVL